MAFKPRGGMVGGGDRGNYEHHSGTKSATKAIRHASRGGRIAATPGGALGNHAPLDRSYSGEGSKGPWEPHEMPSPNVPIRTRNRQAGNLN